MPDQIANRKRNTLKLIWVLLITYCLASPLFGQDMGTSEYLLRHFTDQNGLPQNSVKSIIKDSNGFIWFTTEDGIVRFDGQSFKTFNKNNLATSSNRFRHFESVLGKGKIYTQNSDDDYFLIEDGKVFPAPKQKRAIDKLRFPNDSTYWAEGLWDNDRSYLDLNLKFKSINIPTKPGEYYQCFHDRVIFNGPAKTRTIIPIKIPDLWGLFTLHKTLYYRNPSGTLIYFTRNKAAAVSLTGEILRHQLWTGPKTAYSVLWNINADQTFCIRLGNSIFLAERKTGNTIKTTLLLKYFDFENNEIGSILYDQLGKTLWLGSKNNGLFWLSPKQFRTAHSVENNRTSEVYYAQTPYDSSSIYTQHGLVLGVDKNGKSVSSRVKDLKANKYALLTDSRGYIWMEINNELVKADHQFRVIKKWKVKSEITTLFEGSDNWVYAGKRVQGLIRINNADTTKVYETVTDKIRRVSYLSQQSAEILLVGTDHGLFKYNLRSKQVIPVNGLQSKHIRSIYCPTPYDKIWVTTYGDGFFLLENNKLTGFPLDTDKYLATSHCLIEDRRGFFWITTNKGLFQASKQDLISYAANTKSDVYYAYYNRDNGFGSNEFNGGCQPCGINLRNGTISFPSMNGLIFFEPDEILLNSNDTNIFFDEIKIDNVNTPVAESIELNHHFSLLQVNVSTPYLQNRKNVQLQYSLTENLKKPLWLPVNGDGIISASSLPTGDYTLQVRKLRGFGEKMYVTKTMEFKVLPAWYETWLARLAFFLCFGLLLFFIVKWRNQNLVKQNKVLETRINAKTETLNVTLGNLQTSQSNLQRQIFLYERLVGSISHDIRTPLIFLTRSSEYLFTQLESAENRDSVLTNIGKRNWEFSGRLLNLTNNLLDFIKSTLRKDYSESEIFNLYNLIEEKIEIFLPIALHKSTVISNNVQINRTIKGQPGMVSVIFYNLLDNALKATKNGTIVISDETVNNKLHISISDSGPGMPLEIVGWINNFTFGNINSSHPQHSGIGLVITIELASLVNINIHAASCETGGTTMTMTFPEEMNQG